MVKPTAAESSRYTPLRGSARENSMSVTATRGFTIDSLNHVVLRVRDLGRSEAFYRDVLGLQIRRQVPGRMTFFTCGVNDHDLAVMQLGPDAPPAEENRVGLYHY